MHSRTVYISLIYLFAAANASDNLGKHRSKRIVNGTIVSIKDAPYMLQLRNSYVGTFCGGTLITPQHMLTAAHCVYNLHERQRKDYKIVAGASWRNNAGVQRKIQTVTLHPDYNETDYSADVAIIKLDKPFGENKKIKVLKKFCSRPLKPGEYIRVFGWGGKKKVASSMMLLPSDYSNELRTVRLPVISSENCRKRLQPRTLLANLYGRDYRITDNNVCDYKYDYDACQSDSGGPGMFEGQLCAVVTWGSGCAYGGYPAVFTSYYAVRDFIAQHIRSYVLNMSESRD